MIIVEGFGNVNYAALDDMSLAVLAEGGDKNAEEELKIRYPALPASFEVGSEATLRKATYSQRVLIKAARDDGYYLVENLATAKSGWVAGADLEQE